MGQISDFLLNKGAAVDNVAVEAPAFSLTKVMAIVAPVMTALVTVLTAALKDYTFSSGQITALLIGVMAFLAVTGAADVLARGMATYAQKNADSAVEVAKTAAASAVDSAKYAAEAAEKSAHLAAKAAEKSAAGRARWIRFNDPIRGRLIAAGEDEDITVVGASDGAYLCAHNGQGLSWEPSEKVSFRP